MYNREVEQAKCSLAWVWWRQALS